MNSLDKMEDYELLEKQAAIMHMAEKYGVDWHRLVQYKDCGWNNTTLRYLDNAKWYEYRYALGVVEGKPVFEGDTLYYPDGEKCTVQDRCVATGRIPVLTESIGACGEPATNLSWNPPKPKTVMVETLVCDAEFFANDAPRMMSEIEDILNRRKESCRKALEAMK